MTGVILGVLELEDVVEIQLASVKTVVEQPILDVGSMQLKSEVVRQGFEVGRQLAAVTTFVTQPMLEEGILQETVVERHSEVGKQLAAVTTFVTHAILDAGSLQETVVERHGSRRVVEIQLAAVKVAVVQSVL